MNPDLARFLAAFAFVLCIVAAVCMAASGCRSFEGYLTAFLVAVFALFVGKTQPA